MADNDIGDEGAKSICQILRVNNTLTALDLGCVEDLKKKGKIKKPRKNIIDLQTMGLGLKSQS